MMRLSDLLAVFVGGGLGSLARYLIGLAFLQRFGAGFPYGTLCVNLVGCFLIGVIAELAQTRAFGLPSTVRMFLVVGVLGGFTTFSTFSYDAVTLASDALSLPALAYVLVSVAGGIVAVFAGIVVARLGV
jgi:CrcB protein